MPKTSVYLLWAESFQIEMMTLDKNETKNAANITSNPNYDVIEFNSPTGNVSTEVGTITVLVPN